jgi:hypothetical protein
MATAKDIAFNLDQIGSTFNNKKMNKHVRVLSQHVIYYLKRYDITTVYDHCLKIFEYIQYNIDTNYMKPEVELSNVISAVESLQSMSRNTIVESFRSYLEKTCNYSADDYDKYLISNMYTRTGALLIARGIVDMDIDSDSGDSGDSAASSVSADSATDSDSESYYDDCGSYCTDDEVRENIRQVREEEDECECCMGDVILPASYLLQPPPTYEEDKEWMEVYYKYKKYNKLYEYIHEHVDSIAYDPDLRNKYIITLMGINNRIYNFKDLGEARSPYYRNFDI